MKNSVIYVSLLVCMVSTCSALQCFVCNSHYHKGCSQSPVPTKYLVDCTLDKKQPLPTKNKDDEGTRTKRATSESPGPLIDVTIGSPTEKNFTMCRKLTVTIPDQQNGNLPLKPAHTRVFRSCGWSPDPSAVKGAAPCRYGTGEGIQNYMCTCTENGCNAAGNLHVSKTFALFALISSFFVWTIK